MRMIVFFFGQWHSSHWYNEMTKKTIYKKNGNEYLTAIDLIWFFLWSLLFFHSVSPLLLCCLGRLYALFCFLLSFLIYLLDLFFWCFRNIIIINYITIFFSATWSATQEKTMCDNCKSWFELWRGIKPKKRNIESLKEIKIVWIVINSMLILLFFCL